MTEERRQRRAALLEAADRAKRVKGVEHKQAAVEAEDEMLGEFTARISDWQLDRTGERFAPDAFDNAIRKLRADGRPIPVLFGHDQQSMQAVLGHVMPDGLHVLDDGLYAKGWLDTSHDVGRKLHEMLRRDVLRWSVGFTVKRSHREGGVRVLDEVDELLELSAVPVPANSRTATLSAKGHDDDEQDELPSRDELERRLVALGVINAPPHLRMFDEMLKLLRPPETSEPDEDAPVSAVALAGKSIEVDRKAAQSTKIATFEC